MQLFKFSSTPEIFCTSLTFFCEKYFLSKILELLINFYYSPPNDELTADDLKSLRIILHNQMNGRKEDSRKFQKLLDENRQAYLEAVELIQQS